MADDKSAKDDEKKTDDKGDDNLGDAGKRALERERQARRDAEARLRELEPLAAKAKELEDAKKSEAEKLTAKIDDLTSKLEASDLRAMRAEVAREKGLSARQAERLQGKTRDELVADADDLLETFKPATGSENGKNDDKEGKDSKDESGDDNRRDRGEPGRRPKEKLRSGSVTDDDDKDDDFDPDKVAELVRRRRF
jgi:hypothetical protein